jgi:hypothetical protein
MDAEKFFETFTNLSDQEKQNILDNSLVHYVNKEANPKVNTLVNSHIESMFDDMLALENAKMIHPSAYLASALCAVVLKMRQHHSNKLIQSMFDQTMLVDMKLMGTKDDGKRH